MSPKFNAAVLIFTEADILDYSAPLEVLNNSAPAGREVAFKTTTVGFQNPTKVAQNAITIIPDLSIQELETNLENYDILVVPGAAVDPIKALLSPDSAEGKAIVSLIQKFTSLPPRKETGHRVIQSVCTGAVLLAAAGILANRTVTTHHLCYDVVKQVADQVAGGNSNIKVVKKRWVDAGTTDAGVQILNAGGVTSGLDTTLYLVENLAGKEQADWTAEIIEFERRKQDNAWGISN
ncbi:class I glutamine amidotransferase-like protein [Dendryphion nanum]|uniref:Class I glutamine amidotransferase-like protein n=1 Tax=Dendryphion nanum TaxID=256645 RepID=A0A9P9D4X6_9PLEO|nr:class I glutamine amidotransferase-like protein [Dendryphion nanum]